MKNRDLIKKLNQAGFEMVRNGGNHDIFKKGNIEIPVPRHKEINEMTAKKILKDAGL